MLYQAYQTHSDLIAPWREMARQVSLALSYPQWHRHQPVRSVSAACDVLCHAALTHGRPTFGIHTVESGGAVLEVVEEAVQRLPFGTLLHMAKPQAPAQPKVLIVAPMSGHFATLLRETARTMLADHDVYITDWHNARDVPLADGRFGMDEYVDHLIAFMETIGPGGHMLAICQPCVAALSAAAVMAEDGNQAQPRSLTLMAGPIDCRVNPTTVNKLARSKPISWFADNLIATVPWRHAGAGRRVYPGFLQLTAFMNMNLERHVSSFVGMYNNLVAGELEKAEATRAFYAEYFAVLDLTEEFYLETVQRVFQDYDLALGRLTWHGRPVDPAAIRRTALLTVEGERDDICAIGQTVAAHELCSGLRPYMKSHHVQTGVGHYGVFSGRKWNQQIYPIVRDMIHTVQP
ncbi:polyhydroxyalkanoate depolymerase [Pigmentiphaga soli]|uniref:Polyhydroxyalkanoate depolymerase n=1 Tax=Pigmentiphaga soli TaxID=1007095 RepID=A0ABP8HA39_9BURK